MRTYCRFHAQPDAWRQVQPGGHPKCPPRLQVASLTAEVEGSKVTCEAVKLPFEGRTFTGAAPCAACPGNAALNAAAHAIRQTWLSALSCRPCSAVAKACKTRLCCRNRHGRAASSMEGSKDDMPATPVFLLTAWPSSPQASLPCQLAASARSPATLLWRQATRRCPMPPRCRPAAAPSPAPWCQLAATPPSSKMSTTQSTSMFPGEPRQRRPMEQEGCRRHAAASAQCAVLLSLFACSTAARARGGWDRK